RAILHPRTGGGRPRRDDQHGAEQRAGEPNGAHHRSLPSRIFSPPPIYPAVHPSGKPLRGSPSPAGWPAYSRNAYTLLGPCEVAMYSVPLATAAELYSAIPPWG